MYNAVRHHEVYLSRNKCFKVKSSYSSQSKAPQQNPKTTYKPWYQKTTAFAAATVDQSEHGSEPVGSDADRGTETEEVETTSEELSGTYLPKFLSDSPIGGDWSINVKMANPIQANEHCKKCCVERNSPDYFIKDCPQVKNG